MNIPILYQDSSILIIDKPSGLFMHPNQYTQNKPNCVNILGGIVQKKVLTCHRLDRRTSGAVVFALRKDAAAGVTEQFKERQVKKRYLALVRGLLTEEIYTNRPIKDHYSKDKKLLEAESLIRPLAHGELPADMIPEIPDTQPDLKSDGSNSGDNGDLMPAGSKVVGNANANLSFEGLRETRYSLVEVELLTGKTHQARSHLAALSHPVIGDNLHGDKLQNHLFAEVFQTDEMFLRSALLEFVHPADQRIIRVQLGPADSWLPILQTLRFPENWTSAQPPEVSRE